MCSTLVIFFFSSRRRHTRYWRDWSSDVCSSDLEAADTRSTAILATYVVQQVLTCVFTGLNVVFFLTRTPVVGDRAAWRGQIGRASCRERVYIAVVAATVKESVVICHSDAVQALK